MSAPPALQGQPSPPAQKAPTPLPAKPQSASSGASRLGGHTGGQWTLDVGSPAPCGHRVGIYGTGGIGKSSLCTMAPGPIAYFDLDISLSKLEGQCDLSSVHPIDNALSWDALLGMLSLGQEVWAPYHTICIDSLTRAEDFAREWMIGQAAKGGKECRYFSDTVGYGKEYGQLYDEFLRLLSVLERHTLAGRHVVLVMHQEISKTVNTAGDDYKSVKPRLTSADKCNICDRVKEWLDHLLYIEYDVNVQKGKATGGNSRTIHCQEQARFAAKSRSLTEFIPYRQQDPTLWRKLFPVS